ncbi:hypothetical protein T484DRAFT_1967370 [Baffinella frigidus]|nr:hypothetical protein T484DRAFT_1967370 [Cryptophyta sp. CCMP2293]
MAAADNFKVRIQATRALRGMACGGGEAAAAGPAIEAGGRGAERLAGGWAQLLAAWRKVLSCMTDGLVLSDPSQYKYKDTLRKEEQRCLLSLTALLANLPNDLSETVGDSGGGRVTREEVVGVLECVRTVAHAGEDEALCSAAAAALIPLLLLLLPGSGSEEGVSALSLAGEAGGGDVVLAELVGIRDGRMPLDEGRFEGRSLLP